MSATVPTLRVEGLSKRYGERVALDALSCTLQPGCFVALLGPHGAGLGCAGLKQARFSLTQCKPGVQAEPPSGRFQRSLR
jgi:ABC-type phosphonate transport system ATPase subunit